MEHHCMNCERGVLEILYWRAAAQRYHHERIFIERWILPRLEREVSTLRAQNGELARSHSRLRSALRARAVSGSVGPTSLSGSL